MPQFKPFKGIRPVKEIAGFFSTRSIDSYSYEELEEEVASNPDSFLQIIKPAWVEENLSDEAKNNQIRQNFVEFLNSERSERDKSSFYIYQITKPGKEHTKALVGLVNLNDYAAGKIKKHEETLTKRVELFAD